ncbi:MAG TPA: hypothetical protein VF141_08160, partial [Chryseolinea sp.]
VRVLKMLEFLHTQEVNVISQGEVQYETWAVEIEYAVIECVVNSYLWVANTECAVAKGQEGDLVMRAASNDGYSGVG